MSSSCLRELEFCSLSNTWEIKSQEKFRDSPQAIEILRSQTIRLQSFWWGSLQFEWWFSKSGPWASSSNITWELIRNAMQTLRPQPRPTALKPWGRGPEICLLVKLQVSLRHTEV